MAAYVLVDTRDPFAAGNGRRYELASALAGNGDQVTVFLAQNAVLATRSASAAAPELEALAGRARVVADDFSLRERAIDEPELVAGVAVAGIDTLVDLVMEDGSKPLWL